MIAPAATQENPELICTNYFLQHNEAAGKVSEVAHAGFYFCGGWSRGNCTVIKNCCCCCVVMEIRSSTEEIGYSLTSALYFTGN